MAGYHSQWGYYVKLDHGNGIETLYAHMEAGSLKVHLVRTSFKASS
ncbi:hypothetical protein [Streptococcus iniae]